jgi:hypothetical protein
MNIELVCSDCGRPLSEHICPDMLDRAEVIEIFRWLLGSDDFPYRKEGEGMFYWRDELLQKLNDIGITL